MASRPSIRRAPQPPPAGNAAAGSSPPVDKPPVDHPDVGDPPVTEPVPSEPRPLTVAPAQEWNTKPEPTGENAPDVVQQRALTDRFLPAWLRPRTPVGELRWIPGRRRSKLPEGASHEEFDDDTADAESEDSPPQAPAPEPSARAGAPRRVLLPAPLARGVAYLMLRWRTLLQLRMVVLTMLLSIVATTVVGAVLTGLVSERLVETRRTQAEQEAARNAASLNQLLNNGVAANPDAINQAVREGLSRIEASYQDESGSGIILLRSPVQPSAGGDERSAAQGFSSGRLGVDIVPDQLRTRVQQRDTRQVMSIEVKDSQTGQTGPGLIVGQPISIPLSGVYELYFVSSLDREQSTLLSVQRLMAGGMLGLVVLLGGVAYLVSRVVVSPVRQAGLAAERLAEGNLDERIPVKGDDELAKLARSFNDMAQGLQAQIEQLEELSRVQQRFVSDVSHELRTPLTTMRMAGEVLYDAREELDPMAKRSAELLTGQLDRFDALLSDLLEISRFDAGAAVLNAEPTHLAPLVEKVVEAAQPLAERKPTLLRVHLQPGPVTAEVDHRRIERILRNLVDNAIEHCETKPVDIWLGADEHAVAVLVRDYGVGLSKEDVPRVFDKFWRADPARARTTGGTGLGLAISAEDALLHGGRLEVWGRPDAGAAFRLTLPKVKGAVLAGSPLPLGPRVPVE